MIIFDWIFGIWLLLTRGLDGAVIYSLENIDFSKIDDDEIIELRDYAYEVKDLYIGGHVWDAANKAIRRIDAEIQIRILAKIKGH